MSSDDPATTVAGNVVLTGFMGTGKTTVGRIVAERLGFDFVDTDELIEADHGPIPVIFAEQGEAAFRAIERRAAEALATRTSTVIATGGRFMLDEANVAALGATARVYCLTAPAEVIAERLLIEGTTDRPLLDVDDPGVRIATLLAERAGGYSRFEQVSTVGRDPEEVADEIIQRLGS